MNKVCVIGLGYIGLPTAILLAKNKYQVIGVDINQKVVNSINKKEIHIKEPHLSLENVDIKAYTTPQKADVFIIAVPTPLINYKADLSYVIDALKSIKPFLEDGNIIILESTSPVGTTQKIAQIIDKNVYIGYCPERVLPGNIMYELVHNDRIVGGIDKPSSKKIKNFYKTFVKGNIFTTDSNTAELIKLSENAFRDVNIAFANELSLICDQFDINVNELISLANKHPRVNILQPGIGVGGHCIAIDPYFIIETFDAKLIKTAREVNKYKTQYIIQKIKNKILEYRSKHNKDPKIVCLGLSYKPNIDDLRESPALYIVNALKKEYPIYVIEPNISGFENQVSLEDIDTFDLAIKLVAHKEFEDLKNIWDLSKV